MATPYSPILSLRETQRYDLHAAILDGSRQNPGNSLALEISKTLERKLGRTSTGVMIPPEVVHGHPDAGPQMSRTLTATGAPANGGYTIGQQVAPLWSFVHGQSVIFRLGAGFYPELTGNLGMPTEGTSNEAEWCAEGSAPSGSHESTFGQFIGTPHRLVAVRKMSKQWLAQSGPSAESITKRILGAALAAGIDRAALVGIGGKQPIGLLNDADVTTVSLGAAGAAPSWGKLTEAIQVPIGNSHTLTENAGWAVSANTRSKVAQVPIFANTAIPCLHTVMGQDWIGGFRSFASTMLPDDGIKTSGTALGSAIFSSDWSTLQILQWGAVEIISDVFAYARTGHVEVVISILADVAKPRPGAFAKIKDVVCT